MAENSIHGLQQQRTLMATAEAKGESLAATRLAEMQTVLESERRRTVEVTNELNSLKMKLGALQGQLEARSAEYSMVVQKLATVELDLENWKAAKAGQQYQGGGKKK